MNIFLLKVQGHIDEGNIKVDNLGKQGALDGEYQYQKFITTQSTIFIEW